MVIHKKIGEILTTNEVISDVVLAEALATQASAPIDNVSRIGQILLNKEVITGNQLIEALVAQANIVTVNLESLQIGADILALIPAEIVNKYNLIPIKLVDGFIHVVMADPFVTQALDEIRVLTGYKVKRFYAHPVAVEQALLNFYGSNVARMLEDLAPEDVVDESIDIDEVSSAKLHELAREPSLVNLVNLILMEAIDARASDIHIEPFETELKIRYRVDGVLIERAPSPKRLHLAIISRIKILGNMDIAERFVPQDGHIEFSAHRGKVDIRVSTVPSVFGETVVMRILDRTNALVSLSALGMADATLSGFTSCLSKAHGIVLVTGPTGSGKTTTLYSALKQIYSPQIKIITIEDPVEYQLNGIIQMPVNAKRGLTFSTGLRHILRQDPDVVMVGEIRDGETADIAVRAALTGHLVFSTLHTNDAAGAITRLIDMKIEPFLLASALEAVLAQRLVRKVCKACKQPYEPDAQMLKLLSRSNELAQDGVYYKGVGCEECMQTGLRGRVGIYELLRVTDNMRNAIGQRATAEEILASAGEDHLFMRQDGISKILQGLTLPEEVVRVTQE